MRRVTRCLVTQKAKQHNNIAKKKAHTMKLDPTKMKDWQIAEAAEATLRPAKDLAAELGLRDDEWDPYGRVLAKVDVAKVLARVG